MSSNYASNFHYSVKRGGDVVADVVGTAHLGLKEHTQLNPTIQEAAQKASIVAFEHLQSDVVDVQSRILSNTGGIGCAVDLAQRRFNAYHTTHFDREQLENYRKQPSQEGQDVSHKQFKDVDFNLGTETLIEQELGDRKDKIRSLENFWEIVDVFTYTQTAFQIAQQEPSQKEDLMEAEKRFMSETMAVLQGDRAGVVRLLKEQKLQSPAAHHFIIEERNQLFVDRIEPLIKEATAKNRVLMAVGSLHLFNEKGVLALLQERLGSDYSIQEVER